MSDLPQARALPGKPFDVKARLKKKRSAKARASTCTPPFEMVRPFLSGKRLRGLTEDPTPETGSEGPAPAAAEKPTSELTEIWSEAEAQPDKGDAKP